jgi:hypothetical protein
MKTRRHEKHKGREVQRKVARYQNSSSPLCLCGFPALRFIGWLLLLGCSDGKTSVTGSVTLDSQPVASGVVTFVKQDGELIREGAVIKDGRFEVQVPPGKYRLELSGQKVVGKRKQKGFDGKDEDVELTEELFPARYNANSALTEEIKAGHNPIKLDLKGGN